MPHLTAQPPISEVEPGPNDKVYPPQKLALLLDQLAAEGVSPQEALAGVGVSEEAVGWPDTRLSLNQMIASHQNALRLSRDPNFAYRLGLRFHAPAHGMYGFALLSSTDYRQTIDFAMRYRQLAVPLVHVDFSETSTSGVWTMTPLAHAAMTPRLCRYLLELQIGTHLALHRDVMNAGFNAQQIRLTLDPSEDPARYVELFGCPVLFGQPQNQMLFDVAWLNQRPELGNETTFGAVQKICDVLIGDLRLRIGFAGRVRQYLLANLMKSVRVGNVARHFEMSVRTLRRKLLEEDTTYRQLLDDLRRDLAIRYLRDTVMTVDDIGAALGFSEPTNFRQAFRRWTKATPSDFRA